LSTAPTTCYYTALGLAPEATAEEIASAYGRAMSRFKRRLAAGNPLPAEHLDEIRAAYRTLSVSGARAAYDEARRPAAGQSAAPAATAAPLAATSITAVRPAVKARGGDEAADADADADADPATVEFRGEGREYLRIWLVNVALSVLTLGIYSAWAKVRREKYFHRNFIVDDAAFDYHGNPRAILVGRILLVVMLGLMSLAEDIAPTVHFVASLAAMFAFPWLLVRSMQFRARNTSYRGIRFGFVGTYREALVLYLVHGGLTAITFGLYFPAFLQKQKAFLASRLRFGDMPCTFDAGVAAFYRGMMVPLVLWLSLPVVGLALFGAAAALGPAGGVLLIALVPVAILLVVLLLNLLLVPYVRVVGTNLLWNHTQLGETRFASTQTVRSYLNLVVANWLLVLLTLGFYWPFAQVRLAQYRARNLSVINPEALASSIAAQQAAPPALGDEAIDAFDFDIAL
jgi:uncharacterized membrane protein YjgN (DUF898 family)